MVIFPDDCSIRDFLFLTKIQSSFTNLLCTIGTIFEYSSLEIFNELVVMTSLPTNSLYQLSRSKEKRRENKIQRLKNEGLKGLLF